MNQLAPIEYATYDLNWKTPFMLSFPKLTKPDKKLANQISEFEIPISVYPKEAP